MTTSLLSSALRCAPSLLVATATLLLAGCGKDEKKTAAATKPAAGVPGVTTDEQKVSYGIGYNMGTGVSGQKGFIGDQAALKAGLEDGLTKTKTRIPEQELEKAFQAVQQKAAVVAAAE